MPSTLSAAERTAVQRVLLHRLQVAAPLVAGLMLALALTKRWAAPQADETSLLAMVAGDVLFAVFLLASREAIRRGWLAPRHADAATALLVLLVVADAALHTRILGGPPEVEATTFVLAMMGSAIFFTDARWFAAGLAATVGAWLVATGGNGITRTIVVHALTALAAAVITFRLQTRTVLGAERMRMLADERARRAEALAEELKARARDLEAFAYSAAHDLRAPLRGAAALTDVLLEEAGPRLDAESLANLRRVRAENERLGRLVQDLLALSRVGREALRVEPVDVSALAREAVASLRASDPARRIEVEIQPDLKAEADPALLRVVLENLLGNAWKYTGAQPHARISVGAEDLPRGRAFRVRDNGIGFPGAKAGELFEPFRRLASAAGFEGTGVGLATVKRIVTRHGGEAWAEGAPGEGATFWFTLPARS